MLKNKKALLGITIGTLVGLIILIILYFIFLGNKNDKPNIVSDVFKSFFPYGETGTLPTNNNSDDFLFTDNGPKREEIIAKLRNLSEKPVSGYHSFERKASSTAPTTEIAVRFIDQATGHLEETTESTTTIKTLSNTTIPKSWEAYFASKDSFVLRMFDSETDTIETFVASLVPKTATSTDEFVTKGSFFSPNIKALALIPEGMLTLYSSINSSTGYISAPVGTREIKVLSSPLSEWNLWPTGKSIVLFISKPSANYPGNVFFFDLNNRSFSKVLGPLNGLTAIASPDGSILIYSQSTAGGINLFYTKRKLIKANKLISKTLPEKCVWSKKDSDVVYCFVPETLPEGLYPDDWYKGKISFSDQIVKINTETGLETALVSLSSESGISIDAIRPELDPKEKYIYFLNKNDNSLWSWEI